MRAKLARDGELDGIVIVSENDAMARISAPDLGERSLGRSAHIRMHARKIGRTVKPVLGAMANQNAGRLRKGDQAAQQSHAIVAVDDVGA